MRLLVCAFNFEYVSSPLDPLRLRLVGGGLQYRYEYSVQLRLVFGACCRLLEYLRPLLEALAPWCRGARVEGAPRVLLLRPLSQNNLTHKLIPHRVVSLCFSLTQRRQSWMQARKLSSMCLGRVGDRRMVQEDAHLSEVRWYEIVRGRKGCDHGSSGGGGGEDGEWCG